MELPIVMCSILKQCWSVGYVSMLTLSLIFNNAKQNIFKEKFQLVLNTLIYYSKVGLRQFKVVLETSKMRKDYKWTDKTGGKFNEIFYRKLI